MQPVNDQLSVNRRTPDLEDYIDIARRHKAWILGPTFATLVAAVVVACLWPNTYVSTATIRVVPPSVPERYVTSNVTGSEFNQRINSMANVILSRSNMINMIQTYNLYPRDRRTHPIEDLVEQMKRDIGIGGVMPLQRGNSSSAVFQIEFHYDNRLTAQKVCQELVSRFIDEHIRLRSNQSTMTTSFLKDQWEQAKRELDGVEAKLNAYRTANRDRMPEQAAINLQALHAAESQMSNLQASISRANMEKLQLETQLDQAKKAVAYLSSPQEEVAVVQEKNLRLTEVERDLANMRLALSAMRERYTEENPDVKRMRSQISVLEATRTSLLTEESRKPRPRAVRAQLTPEAQRDLKNAEAKVAGVNTELQIREQQLQEYNRQMTQLNSDMKTLQMRVSSGTVSDAEYSLLLQDRDLARKKYDDLDLKKSQSELATDLENRKASETLEMLDPANIPLEPILPNRTLIISVGVVIGLIIGCVFAAVFEMRDTTLKNLKDVRAYTQLSVLASVPLLENDLMVRRRQRLRWLAWSAGVLVGVFIMAGSAAYYMMNKS